MVTSGTYLKKPLFRGADRLRYLCEMLLKLAAEHAWQLQAWAVFPNHYHFVGLECGGLPPLSKAGVSPGLTDTTSKREQAPAPQTGIPKRQQAAALQRTTLVEFLRHLHSVTSIQANRWDETPGRKSWFNYWDTRLTFEKSYLARLSYVHKNAVHHGLVREPSLYPWCSAGWFERQAAPSFYKTVMAMKVDAVQVVDDFPLDVSDV